MKSMTETFISFCNSEGIHYRKIGAHGYRIGFQGDHARYDSVIEIQEEFAQLTIHTLTPLPVSVSQRNRIIDLIARINSRLCFSAFEISSNSNIIACRVGIRTGGANIHQDIIKEAIFDNWTDSDVFFPAIAAVLITDSDPEQAMKIALDKISDAISSDSESHLPLRHRGNLN